MTADFVIHMLLGLLPVICFLTGLVYLDSYKLVGIRWVVGVIVIGALIAGTSYLVHSYFLDRIDIEFASYTRYISPPIEEVLKGAIILALIRMKRLEEALVELEIAARLRPDNPRYPYVYAVALQTVGKIDMARQVLRKASADHPGDREMKSFLATLEGQK